jgi:predicted nucleic-acid-binding Zn-ribbon protein
MSCEHKFVDTKKDGGSTGEWIVIYCQNCGFIAFDQAKQGIDGDYQKFLSKTILT